MSGETFWIRLDIHDLEPADDLDANSIEFWDLIADDIATAVEKTLDRSVWVKDYSDLELS